MNIDEYFSITHMGINPVAAAFINARQHLMDSIYKHYPLHYVKLTSNWLFKTKFLIII